MLISSRSPATVQLYVSRGLGFGNGHLWAPRFNSTPEVSVFTLRHAERLHGRTRVA